ncbi:MAG: hemolysin family protein [Pyrinomonadaceae bacterium]
MGIEILIGIAILFALVFLATVDLAFSQLSDISLRRLSSESDDTLSKRSTQLLRTILEDRARFRFALSSAIQALLIGFTVLVTWMVLNMTNAVGWILMWALLIGLVVTVVFRQILPRLFVRTRPEQKLLWLLPIVRPLYSAATVLTSPVSSFFKTREQQKLEQTQTPDAPDDEADSGTDQLQALMEVGEAEGIIEEDEREMIESLFEFNETRTGEIMTPRTEICAVPITSSIKEVRDLMIEEKYSRVPVFRENIDNVEGIVYVRDLLQAWSNGMENESISELLREAYFVPETKSAAELLKTMQSDHVQFAVVIDEYGGVAGIVTVEDILEEIVGEIEDEDIGDEEIIEIFEGDEGYWDILGSTEIDKIERLFDLDLEDEEYTTLAGLVTSKTGYVPKVGETVTADGLQYEVLKGDDKKVELVRVRLTRPKQSDNALEA